MGSKRILRNCIWVVVSILAFQTCIQPDQKQTSRQLAEELNFSVPEHGFVSRQPATRWEESMITGNGTIGALVPGDPLDERIIISHERLFMPEYYPTDAPPLYKYMDQIRELTLAGKGNKAAELLTVAAEEAGIDELIWTDPLVPACQLEIISLADNKISEYARSVNYETGEALTAWSVGEEVYQRSVFFSRPDKLGVLKMKGTGKLNYQFRLNQLPLPEGEDEDEIHIDELIQENVHGVNGHELYYSTIFKKQWDGSLKGYKVIATFRNSGGTISSDNEWITVSDADEILVLMDIKLSWTLPLEEPDQLGMISEQTYDELLSNHKGIHAEMFNRFSFQLGDADQEVQFAEDMLASSSAGNLNPQLLNQLCKAARYELISSTGEIPPTLQGIWGGTWRPAWSGDFTLNGNVPSAIACGLNCNYQEVTEAYVNYMLSMLDDFEDNASGMFQAPGIFVPSRTSSSGKTYHFLEEYPHLLWWAGGAWTSQFFYDYWQYTGDEKFLTKKAIPFMTAVEEFYEFILTEDDMNYLMFLPSYSPEVAPIDQYVLSINATMDVAALKQFLRNLITLAEQGWLENGQSAKWLDMLQRLPGYEIDEQGDLKEWLWPGYENNNRHRHASHLYPLFYEVDPEFEERPELIEAAKTAIENRLKYRRDNNGAEMAFGLVQKGLAAAHIRDTEHACECVDWLCNSYWSPAFTSYHDPGEIFNVDIAGGLPAVVAEMIIQSSADEIELLPALPAQWPDGNISGVLTRCGVVIDLTWKKSEPVSATFTASRDTRFDLILDDKKWTIELTEGQADTKKDF